MKIGILTYHRTLNYGACLQSIATRVLLERMGHDAYYVDYWPEYHKRMYNVVNWYNFVHGSLFGNIKYLMPYSGFITIMWIVILLAFYLIALPLGVGAYPGL